VKTIAETVKVSRTDQYRKPKSHKMAGKRFYRKAEDGQYLSLIKRVIDERMTYGYRRVTVLVNRGLKADGRSPVNHKRVYRIMKINNLLLQRHAGISRRVHDGKVSVLRSNLRWCSDVFEVACWNGDRVRVAFSMDCCDREVMSYVATTGGVSGDMIRDLIAESIEARFGIVDRVDGKIQWLSDNGPAYIANATKQFAQMMGLEVCTTPYYSPESNGMAESFVNTFKRDYVHVNPLRDAVSVLEQLPKWFKDYNENHPHKGLHMMSPREYINHQIKLEKCLGK